jgi:hypothetical protein
MDFPLGTQNVELPIDVRDPYTGAPITTGVIMGDWSVYGPASAITPVTFGAGGLVNRGAGVWSLPVPSTLYTVPGVYRLVYDLTDPASVTIEGAEIAFTIGPVVRGAWRMRDLLVSLIRSLGGSVRPSTLINASDLTDTYWGSGTTIAVEQFNGSEIVLIDPATAATYANWFIGRVVNFVNTTGVFTLNRTTGLVADATGRQYALTNIGGTGFMFEHILEELRAAYDEIQPTLLGSVSVGLETVSGTLEYALPDYLDSVARVHAGYSTDADLWDNIDGRWTILGDRRTLVLDEGLGLGAGNALRIEGGIRCELPKLGGGWTDLPGVWLRERVRFGLLSSSPSVAHQRMAQVIYGNLLRMPSPHRMRLPGEVRL